MMRAQGADTHQSVIRGDFVKTLHIFDVDQPFVVNQALLHRQQQLRSSGIHLGRFSKPSEQFGYLLYALRLFQAEWSQHLKNLLPIAS
jgi:hypothetical protein